MSEETKQQKVLRRIGTGFVVLSLAGLGIAGGLHDEKEYQQRKDSEMYKTMYVQNVLAGPAPETFYIHGNDTAFVRIDGKPVQNYFRK